MRVVNRRKEQFTHYIGRPSVFGNPYTLALFSREEAIQKYEAYVRADQALMKEIEALPADAILGCWCKPQACHGDVILKIWEELHNA